MKKKEIFIKTLPNSNALLYKKLLMTTTVVQHVLYYTYYRYLALTTLKISEGQFVVSTDKNCFPINGIHKQCLLKLIAIYIQCSLI